MKNLFKSMMTVAVAAMAFASCSTNFTDEVSYGEKVQFTVNAVNDEITRSTFGEPAEGKYPTLWEANEKFVINVNGEGDGKTTSDVTAKFSADNRSAYLTVGYELASQSDYTLHAMVPASACVYNSITAGKGWQVNIPTAQTPKANSCDAAAQILIGVSETKTTTAESFDMTFKHAVAYGKMSLKNLNLGDATISSVAITSTKNIAGRFYINHKTGVYSDNSGAKSITINTTSTENIWFALAPVDVSGTALSIVVNTNKGTFTKEVTMPANRVFEAGKISAFGVDMTGVALVAPVQYTLLTNINNLKAGDQIVIAAKDANLALSSTQNTNNRGTAAITKSSDKSTISDPGSAVEIFTVAAGTKDNTFALLAQKTKGYIYAASSGSNHLKTQTTNNDNGSWAISVTTAGVATIKAQGSNTRNWLRYNSSSGLFSCYGSGQGDVVIYHLAGEEPEPDTTPEIIPAQTAIEIPADEHYADVALTLKNITETVYVDWDAEWVDEAYTEDNTLYISVLSNETTESRKATFTLTANGAEATVTLTQLGAGSDEIQTITVAELLNKSVNANVWYQLTGTIKNLANTLYGNFDLVDETGTIYVYGLTKTQVASNDQSFSSIGLKENDIVTIIGTRAEYSEKAQVGGPAYYVSHIASCAVPSISCKDNVVTITAEQGATIYYTTNDSNPTTASAVYSEPFTIAATCTVKAFAVAQGKPDSAVASSLCEYVDPNAEVVETATATLSFANKAQRTTFTTTQQVWEQNGIQLINDKAASTNNIADYANPARFYQNSKLTVQAPGNITKIEFTCNNSSYATALKNSITSGGAVSVSGSNVTVIPSASATSFVVAKLSAQVRMNSLKVTYEVAE